MSQPVLYLLGDSIAAGYAPAVTTLLAGVAEVRLRPENGKTSQNLLEQAGVWLAGQSVTVLHLNCGLHDIKRAHDTGELAVPLAAYADNLWRLVPLLRPYAETLVWARTTPVKDGQPNTKKNFDRFTHDVQTYNAAADAVMAEYGVPCNDLYGAVERVGQAQCLSADGVHMTDAGYMLLAEQVVRAVQSYLSGSGREEQQYV